MILAGQSLLLAALMLFWLASESNTTMTIGLILLGLGGALAGVALSAVGYPGLGLTATILAGVILTWTITRPAEGGNGTSGY